VSEGSEWRGVDVIIATKEPSPTIYVAGSLAEMERCRLAMRVAEALGFTVILDWTNLTAPIGASESSAMCERMIEAVGAADVFWFLSSEKISPGKHCELGARRVKRGTRNAIISGPIAGEGSDFYKTIPYYPTDMSAIPHLAEFRKCL
jgi:hypothetical protein